MGRQASFDTLADDRGRHNADQQGHHGHSRPWVATQMNLELTEEQVALRDTVRQYLAEKASVAGHVRPMLDDQTGTTDDVWRGLANLGAMGVLVAAEHDGAGMTMVEAGVVAEELGAALYPGPWSSSAVAAARALARTGADDGLLSG